ncbi:MAG: ribosomal protein S18-alanine N-acetyltransferase [Clostridia bacterium]
MSVSQLTINMQISDLNKQDLSAMADIESEAFCSRAWSLDLLSAELNDNTKHYLAARESGKLLGYAGFAQIGQEAHIMNIAVRKDAQRRGIGRALLQALLHKAVALGITAATLEVSCDNLPAIALYKELGFVSAGIRPDYYEKGEGALILWAYL